MLVSEEGQIIELRPDIKVLILILLDVSLGAIKQDFFNEMAYGLNPYSTGC